MNFHPKTGKNERTKNPAVEAHFPLWTQEIAQGPLKFCCGHKKPRRGGSFFAVGLKFSVVEGQIAVWATKIVLGRVKSRWGR